MHNSRSLIHKLFVQVLDDPSGNSFIENPSAPQRDEALTQIHYVRTREQDIQIGVLVGCFEQLQYRMSYYKGLQCVE